MTLGKFFATITETFISYYYQNLHGVVFRYYPAMINQHDVYHVASFSQWCDGMPYNAKEIFYCYAVPAEVADAMPTVAIRLTPDREQNGYDDSDWYATFYFPATDEIKRVTTGSTRFANALHMMPADVVLPVTPEIAEHCAKLEFERIFPLYIETEKHLIERPSAVQVGFQYLLKEKHAGRGVWAVCEKCNGSGNWTNPNRPSDVRDCYACKAAGVIKTEGKAKALPAGLEGIAMAYTAYFAPYAKTAQITATLRTGNGFVRIPLEKLAECREVDMVACETQARREASKTVSAML